MFLRNTVFPEDAVNPIRNFSPIFGREAPCARGRSVHFGVVPMGDDSDRLRHQQCVCRNPAAVSSGRVLEKKHRRLSMRRSLGASNLAAGLSMWELLLMGLGGISFYILWVLRFLIVLLPAALCKKKQSMDDFSFGVERLVFPRAMFTRGALCPVYSSSSRMAFGEPSGLFVG